MGREGRKRHSAFEELSDEEIMRRARDKRRPVAERRRYRTEEKARRLRNVQKRHST